MMFSFCNLSSVIFWPELLQETDGNMTMLKKLEAFQPKLGFAHFKNWTQERKRHVGENPVCFHCNYYTNKKKTRSSFFTRWITMSPVNCKHVTALSLVTVAVGATWRVQKTFRLHRRETGCTEQDDLPPPAYFCSVQMWPWNTLCPENTG